MNAKIKKINAEYEKNAAKIAELQARQKELDKQRTELENLDIVGMVRSMGMTPEELAAHPASCFVGGVVGRSPMNFFLMKVFSEDGKTGLQGASGRMLVPEAVGAVLENNGYVGKEVITGIRAEDVCLSRASEDGQDGHFSARFQSMTGDGTMLRFQAEDPAFRLRPAAVKAEAFFQPGAAQSGAGKLLLAVAQETGIPGNAAGLGRAGKVLDMPHEKALFIGAGRDKAPDCMNDRINRTRHCSPARPAGHP